MESRFLLAQQEALNTEMSFDVSIYLSFPLLGLFPSVLTLAHLAWAAFLASSLRCSGVSAAIRAFTPLPLAAFPPFLPISRITLEMRSRLMPSSYEELAELARFWD
jgi:hypothetical protein